MTINNMHVRWQNRYLLQNAQVTGIELLEIDLHVRLKEKMSHLAHFQ